MKFLIKSFYVYISNLGLLTVRIISSVCGFFVHTIGGGIKNFLKKFFSFEKTKRSIGRFSFRMAALAVAAAVILTAGFFVGKNNAKTEAVELSIKSKVIGYAETQTDAELARSIALNSVGEASVGGLEFKDVHILPYEISEPENLSEAIIGEAFPDYKKVTEIYAGHKLICAVNDIASAKHIIAEKLEAAKREYPDSTVSFSDNISFKDAYYNSSNDNLWTDTEFSKTVDALDIFPIRHVECEKNLKSVDFDTIEIETNSLFAGDSRVKRRGQDGKEYIVNLVTYIGDKKILSERIMNLSVKSPVSQIIETGMRAESITVSGYTVRQTAGIFCWPAVGLERVTSPYGYRSLGFHRGMDISGANASGSLVVAAAAGVVVEAGWNAGGYGNYVILDHGNNIRTVYGHMLNNSVMVSVGDYLDKGQALGRVGNTGYSFGAHLHFEVRINGTKVDPAPYLGISR